MSFETLEVERAGPVRRIWLDRPDRRNAISVTMLREIGDVFHALETDFEARIAVLAGRGASFCAGMDRRPDPPSQPVRERTEREQRWLGQLGRRACRAIEECEIPVVARIQGHAIGGARRASLGDVTESDGDLLARASASPELQRRFAMKPRKA